MWVLSFVSNRFKNLFDNIIFLSNKLIEVLEFLTLVFRTLQDLHRHVRRNFSKKDNFIVTFWFLSTMSLFVKLIERLRF